MNRANQRAVLQEANMLLVDIRSAEVQYYDSFFNNFATNAALMIGFICGAVSQVPALDNPSGAPYPWIVMYWIGSAGTVGAAVHVLVCAVFVAVFGQGLALRGPIGSMVKAVDGMVSEQEHVLFYFVVTIVFFAFQSIGMYWVMMDSTSAIVSTVITFIAMYYWYHYTLRIYNRFNWGKIKSDWEEERDPINELNDLNPTSDLYKEKKIFMPGDKQSRSLLSKITGRRKEPHVVDDAEPAELKESTLFGIQDFITVSNNDDVTGGYLALKVEKNFLSSSSAWKRYYFVIRGTLIYYYKDKRVYQLEPAEPINRRPIDLEGYIMVAGTMEPPYAISLVPQDPDDIRKTWKFRCDTLTEFNRWVEMLTAALRLCNDASSQSEVVRIPAGQFDTATTVGPVRR